MTAEGARHLYGLWAESYDRDLTTWGYRSPARVAEVAVSLGACGARAALDLGCGTGLSGEALLAAGVQASLTGIDVSRGALDVAAGKGLYAALLETRMDGPLPFDSHAFDLAVAVGSLGYVEDFGALFAEVCRVTAPGALCVWSVSASTWANDERGCRSAALALQAEGLWRKNFESPAEVYLPSHPDDLEREKTIKVLAFRRCGLPSRCSTSSP